MYKISISMPTGELLVGEGDCEASEIPEINGMHLNVRFDRQVGKLVVKGAKANLRLGDFTVFEAQDVTTEICFADYADGGGRHEYVYRGTINEGPIEISVALDTHDRAL